MTTVLTLSNVDTSVSLNPIIANVQIANSTWSAITDTTLGSRGGYILINGSNFANGCSVFFSNSTSAVYPIQLTFFSNTVLRATTPTLTVGTYTVVVVNPNGSTAVGVLLNQNAVTVANTGSLWVSGDNSQGTLGLNDRIRRSSPVQVGLNNNWRSVVTSSYATTGIKTDGSLWLWGGCQDGSLGQNSTAQFRSSPVQVGTQSTNWQTANSTNLNTITMTGMATGAIFNTLAIKTDGTLWFWGSSTAYGIQGTNGTTGINLSSPVQIGTETNWRSVQCSSGSVIATKTDNTLWQWGSQAMIGNNSTGHRSSPVQVAGTNWSLAVSGDRLNLATKTDGTLWSWGYNNFGQLGLTSTINRSSPTQIGSDTNWNLIRPVYTTGTVFSGVLATKTDGTLWAWGRNTYGILGLNDTVARSSPTQVSADTNWNIIGIGAPIATKTDGTLWAWGYNVNGRLGLNNIVSRSSPTQVGTDTNWRACSSGRALSIATKTNGTLWVWGRNTPVANGSTAYRSSPVQVGANNNWSAIPVGPPGDPRATKTDGTLWGWGDSTALPQLAITPVNRSSPVQIGSQWTVSSALAHGAYHFSAAIDTLGRLWTWGYNRNGMLGLSQATNLRLSSPTQVGTNTNWSSFSLGGKIFSAIKTDGTLWMWGAASIFGALGLNAAGTALQRSSPTQIGTNTNWRAVRSGSYSTLATKTDGTLWAWGENTYGRLGLGVNDAHRSSPTQVGTETNWSDNFSTTYVFSTGIKTDGTLWTWGQNNFGQLGLLNTIRRSSPTQVGSDTNWIAIAPGRHACVGVRTQGSIAAGVPRSLWTWGRNHYGQGGLSTIEYRSSPTQVGDFNDWLSLDTGISLLSTGYRPLGFSLIRNKGNLRDVELFVSGSNDTGTLGLNDRISRSSPTLVGGNNSWTQVSGGSQSWRGIRHSRLYSTGANYGGQLGLNNRVYRSSPTQVGTDTNWLFVSGGNNVLALKTNGTLWGWGYNNSGSLGLLDTIRRSSPTQVSSDVWRAISIYIQSCLGIKTNGTLWSWGSNQGTYIGSLGLNDTINRSNPTQVGTDVNWLSIHNSGPRSVAIKTDNTLWTWGNNNYGRLGLNDTINRSSPTQVGTNTNWIKANFRFGLKSDGTLWAWGQAAAAGALGLNDTINRSSPTQVGTNTNWSDIAQSFALKTDGTLWGWGGNTLGELGLNDRINRSSPTQVGANTKWIGISGTFPPLLIASN